MVNPMVRAVCLIIDKHPLNLPLRVRSEKRPGQFRCFTHGVTRMYIALGVTQHTMKQASDGKLQT
jgi:hypothetical protein